MTKKRKDVAGKKHKSHQSAAFMNFDVTSAAAASSSGVLESDMRVLILGDLNFAFAAALALEWNECAKLTATTDASKSRTVAEDAEAEDNIETVKAFGGTVTFRVDATDLLSSEKVAARGKKGPFERIVFLFPAVGAAQSMPTPQSTEAHQALLRGVFKSVLSSQLLCKTRGELHLAISKSKAADWKLLEVATIAGMRVKSTSPFDSSKYQGYEAPPMHARDALTYVLVEVAPKLSKADEKALKIAELAKARPDLRIGPTGQSYKEAWKQRHKKGKR